MLASFHIFNPDNKCRMPPWLLFFLVLILELLLIVICREFRLLNEKWISTILILTGLAQVSYIGYCYVSYQPLYGKLDGQLEFSKDYFVIENTKINLSKISKIDFAFIDYHGRSTSMKAVFEKRLSQGVGNFFEYIDDIGTHRIYFLMHHQNEKKDVYPFIEQAIVFEKISLFRGSELLEIHDYEDLQAFKKRLHLS